MVPCSMFQMRTTPCLANKNKKKLLRRCPITCDPFYNFIYDNLKLFKISQFHILRKLITSTKAKLVIISISIQIYISHVILIN